MISPPWGNDRAGTAWDGNNNHRYTRERGRSNKPLASKRVGRARAIGAYVRTRCGRCRSKPAQVTARDVAFYASLQRSGGRTPQTVLVESLDSVKLPGGSVYFFHLSCFVLHTFVYSVRARGQGAALPSKLK